MTDDCSDVEKNFCTVIILYHNNNTKNVWLTYRVSVNIIDRQNNRHMTVGHHSDSRRKEQRRALTHNDLLNLATARPN